MPRRWLTNEIPTPAFQAKGGFCTRADSMARAPSRRKKNGCRDNRGRAKMDKDGTPGYQKHWENVIICRVGLS